MKKNIISFIMPLVIVASSCQEKKVEKESIPFVKVETVVGANELSTQSYPGRTKSIGEVNAAFRVSGQLLNVFVKEGDYVKKGQLIAEMDPRDYDLQLKATQAEYESVKAEAERVMAMYNEGSTTASNNDKARFGLQQITQKLNNHRNQLADTKLYAPASGYVRTKFHSAGETVSAGMPIINMFEGDGVEIEINLPARDFDKREVLSNGYASFDVIPGEKFAVELSRVSQEANANQLFPVRLRIKGNYDHRKITPGMSTMVYAPMAKENEGSMNIPTTAILNKDGKTFVFVLNEVNGTVEQRIVEVETLHHDGRADVFGGINAGDKVVTAGVHHIKDGDKVKPMQEKSKTNIGGLL